MHDGDEAARRGLREQLGAEVALACGEHLAHRLPGGEEAVVLGVRDLERDDQEHAAGAVRPPDARLAKRCVRPRAGRGAAWPGRRLGGPRGEERRVLVRRDREELDLARGYTAIRSAATVPRAVNTTTPDRSRMVDSNVPAYASPWRSSRIASRMLSVPSGAPAEGGACWSRKRKNAA